MFVLFIACSIGGTEPATAESRSAVAAEHATTIATRAGAIANAARDLEARSDPAREATANRAEEIVRMRALMDQIAELDEVLQADILALEAQARHPTAAAPQSTETTRE